MKILPIILLFASSLSIQAQDFSKLSEIPLDKAEDYAKVENQVRKCADYLLNTPIEKKDLKRFQAGSFMLRWMSGTPDYVFELTSQMEDLAGKSPEMTQVYLAAMLRATFLGLKGGASTQKIEELFLDFCAKPENNAKKTRKVKKALKKR